VWSAIADGEALEEGARATVLSVEGLTVTVGREAR
jgi:hypothetical protein